MIKGIKTVLVLPFEDFLSGLESCFSKFSPFYIIALIISFLVSWWIYVPLHELGHALGCILGGGTVSKLEISPMYGASFLKEIFPFVSVGSDYAGQLTGFDTKGSDLIYLLTDFFPFLLTIFIGVPLLRSAARSKPLWAAIKLGLGLPLAFAPFISFSGDYYEMGSIIISKIANLISPAIKITRWRSDDLFKLAGEIFFSGSPYGLVDIIGVALSFLLGIVLIYATYMLGILWCRIIFDSRTKPSQ
ncbi:MAG: hypothetical protein KAJ31_05955 [Deltaproteobacteria bacterium]|nr:hypothetical protein [Deltaproteobacteria bacterium]